MKGKARFDLNNRMWIDIYDSSIHDIQRATLMGGTLLVYHLIEDEYRLGFNYSEGNIHIQFLGCVISKEHYEAQKTLWGGDQHKVVFPGTELTLLDNQYFL